MNSKAPQQAAALANNTTATPAAALMERLACDVEKLRASDAWLEYLKLAARFYNYSFRNTLLIWSQCPHATRVAGFRQWQERFERHVTKGQKAIKILAPRFKKQQAEGGPIPVGESALIGFLVVSVFDLSQTAGADLPSRPAPPPFKDETGEATALCYSHAAALTLALSLKGCPVLDVAPDTLGRAQGMCIRDRATKAVRIEVSNALPPDEALSVLIHETAHFLLHLGPTAPAPSDLPYTLTRAVAEFEAESTAALVCEVLGLSRLRLSALDYLAGWGADAASLLKVSERVIKAAQAILRMLPTDATLDADE